jgi:hypothetical protein
MTVTGDFRARSDEIARLAIGCGGLAVSIPSLAGIALGAPWQVLLPLSLIALLLGPGVPLMMLRSRMPTVKSMVAGIGLDISLLILIAQGMVMIHVWQPRYVVGALLVLSMMMYITLLACYDMV